MCTYSQHEFFQNRPLALSRFKHWGVVISAESKLLNEMNFENILLLKNFSQILNFKIKSIPDGGQKQKSSAPRRFLQNEELLS